MKGEPHNPIMQDTKDGKPRYYTYGVPFFNYGLLPQTWEDPTHADAETGAFVSCSLVTISTYFADIIYHIWTKILIKAFKFIFNPDWK